MDFINLPKVLRNQLVMEAGQNLIEEDDIPMVVFNLSQPIRSTIKLQQICLKSGSSKIPE